MTRNRRSYPQDIPKLTPFVHGNSQGYSQVCNSMATYVEPDREGLYTYWGIRAGTYDLDCCLIRA